MQVPYRAHMPRNHHVMPRRRTSRKSTLRHNHAVRAYDTIVGNHHQIIDLGSFPNVGPRKTTTINRRVGSDLRIVINLYNSKLRNLHMLSLFHLIPEPVRPNNSPRM